MLGLFFLSIVTWKAKYSFKGFEALCYQSKYRYRLILASAI